MGDWFDSLEWLPTVDTSVLHVGFHWWPCDTALDQWQCLCLSRVPGHLSVGLDLRDLCLDHVVVHNFALLFVYKIPSFTTNSFIFPFSCSDTGCLVPEDSSHNPLLLGFSVLMQADISVRGLLLVSTEVWQNSHKLQGLMYQGGKTWTSAKCCQGKVFCLWRCSQMLRSQKTSSIWCFTVKLVGQMWACILLMGWGLVVATDSQDLCTVHLVRI